MDCDPCGRSNVDRTPKAGSRNTAHRNRFFCVPHAPYLGVTPQDIPDYELPTHPLLEIDVKRAKARDARRAKNTLPVNRTRRALGPDSTTGEVTAPSGVGRPLRRA